MSADSTANLNKFVTRALADPAIAAAFNALVQQGCERDTLSSLFERVRRTEKERVKSRKALKRLARTLQEASTGVAGLTAWSESPNLGLPDDCEAWLRDCSHDLGLLASKILLRMDVHGRNTDPQLDLDRAHIVDYVVQRTGATHDEKLALLLATALDWQHYGVEQHVAWRTGRIPTS